MKGRRAVLDHLNGREAAALLVDGRLDDLLIEADGPRIGAVFRATCDRGLKGQGGAILRLPEGQSAWLRNAQGLKAGDSLLVQVTGAAEGDKAIPVTDRILLKSRFAIATPAAPGTNVSRSIRDDEARARLIALGEEAMEGAPDTLGLVVRTAAVDASDEDVVEDARAMRELAERLMAAPDKGPERLWEGDGPHILAWRDWDVADVVTAPGSFAREGVLEGIDALRSAHVPLAEGSMIVETTRALVAVDVNTGGDTSPAAALKANLAAARTLPRQLRLRGLGGQVVVDFANMPKGQRRQLEQSLRDAFRSDPVETSLVGWTAMGLFELSRKRERVPTAALLGDV
jgi:Ribonuclease G/E